MREVPTKNQIKSGFELLNEGVRIGKLAQDYKVYGMCQFQRHDSPGHAFYEMIQTWKEWSEDIKYCCH